MQQLGLETPPGGQIAINFHAAQSLPAGAENRPRQALHDPRGRAQKFQLLADAAINSTRQVAPALRETPGVRDEWRQFRDQIIQGGEFRGIGAIQAGDLQKAQS